jgi:hypothetical protein
LVWQRTTGKLSEDRNSRFDEPNIKPQFPGVFPCIRPQKKRVIEFALVDLYKQQWQGIKVEGPELLSFSAHHPIQW